MKKLLIRADDLGYSEGINYGIAKTVNEGIVRNVGIMTNMSSVEQGLNLIRSKKVCFGQHTNICVGKPLTNPELIPSLVQSNGEFKTSQDYRNAKEDFVVLDEVLLEIEAQYQRFVELTGEQPHYFEGHAVASKNFFVGLELIAKRHGLKYLAFSFSKEPIRFGNTECYVCVDSMKPDYNPFTSLKNAVQKVPEDACEMFVCHPGYLDAFILKTSTLTFPRVEEVEMLCDSETQKWLMENELKLVTYDDL
jgi:chitin disaccharide deacetylase